MGELGDYVRALRQLLAGDTAIVNGKPVSMLHADGLAGPRPMNVPLWLSAFGPRGAKLAAEIADGIIGPVHPELPTATMVPAPFWNTVRTPAAIECATRSGHGGSSTGTTPTPTAAPRSSTPCRAAGNGGSPSNRSLRRTPAIY